MNPSIVTRLERLERLTVEQNDTFFFDHPLDHVPGMVLFDALLRAARDAHAESTEDTDPARIRASLDFTRICESDAPTTLSCIPAADRGGWSVSAVQDGCDVCVGTVEFVTGEIGQPESPSIPTHAHAPYVVPAPAHLVHRSRPENILVGEVTRPPIESVLLNPLHDHLLQRADPQFRSTTELVEAGRQFIVMLAHSEGGAAIATQMLWLSLTIDIPVRIPRHARTLLRCLEHSGTDHRMICTVLLANADTGTELGMLNYVTRNVDPACYTKLRDR